jgi:hypothetical protein
MWDTEARGTLAKAGSKLPTTFIFSKKIMFYLKLKYSMMFET